MKKIVSPKGTQCPARPRAVESHEPSLWFCLGKIDFLKLRRGDPTLKSRSESFHFILWKDGGASMESRSGENGIVELALCMSSVKKNTLTPLIGDQIRHILRL